MFWLGDGMTWNEKTMSGDSASFFSISLIVAKSFYPAGAWYLNDDWVNAPPGKSCLLTYYFHDINLYATTVVPSD